MPLCCSKKAAQRQKEHEEEVRMRKLEEAARQEQEQREREEARKAEIERIMQEEKQAELMKQKAEEERIENERLAEEQRMSDEEHEMQKQRTFADNGMNADNDNNFVDAEEQSMSRMPSGAASASTEPMHDGQMYSQSSFEMPTFTPFDMSTVDQTARYVANKCGCAMKPEHKPLECAVCQGIDLSDAPLIA
ncbi:GAP45, putative [Babesia ovis]|uniref:GAP45, putative n=1 Tax=Babesia ovis TaxID=5869 RepID=A0A9W5TBB7_BABOV|nr:GAP45, putative [Babesia ovis]